MRVILIMATSADGLISRGGEDAADWVANYDLSFFDPKTREIGTVIIGSNSFRTFMEPLKDRRTIVMSARTDIMDPIEGSLEFFPGEPAELLKQLSDEGLEEVALIGGAQLNGSFLSEGLVDEIYLVVTPHLLGQGLTIASGFDLETPVKLLETRELDNDVVLLHYEVIK